MTEYSEDLGVASREDARPQTEANASAMPSSEPTEWETAADSLIDAMVQRADDKLRRVGEALYEDLLYDVQAFLRDNTRANLKNELERARQEVVDAREQLHRIAATLGLQRITWPGGGRASVEAADGVIAAIEHLRDEARPFGSRDIAAHRTWLADRADWLRKEYLDGGDFAHLSTREAECRYALSRLPQPTDEGSLHAGEPRGDAQRRATPDLDAPTPQPGEA